MWTRRKVRDCAFRPQQANCSYFKCNRLISLFICSCWGQSLWRKSCMQAINLLDVWRHGVDSACSGWILIKNELSLSSLKLKRRVKIDYDGIFMTLSVKMTDKEQVWLQTVLYHFCTRSELRHLVREVKPKLRGVKKEEKGIKTFVFVGLDKIYLCKFYVMCSLFIITNQVH